MKKIIYILLLLPLIINAQNHKETKITPTESKIQIDGYLNEKAWTKATKLSDFIQYEPYNGAKPSRKTIAQITYDQNNLYIAAICYVKNKNEIKKQVTQRDQIGETDNFGIYIDPYQNGTLAFAFFVTAANVQIDYKLDNNTKDFNWDAVWYSASKTSDTAFTIEIQIPFSFLRFPKKDIQSWNINLYRTIQIKRETDTWSYVDNAKNGITNQLGTITGLKIQHKKIFWSLFPHASFLSSGNNINGFTNKDISFGLDIKLGIKQSSIIDIMLLPGFFHIPQDYQNVNLSPFETYFNEKRAFFTEGTEIFNKGNIFYSRRIGQTPSGYKNIVKQLNFNEIITKNPNQTKILNATKFTTKTKKGLALGILNAVTGNTYAITLDTLTNTSRQILTEPWAVYNVMATQIPVPYNSYISFTNTLYYSPDRDYTADVFAPEFILRTPANNYALFYRYSKSYIWDTTNLSNGNAYNFYFAKTSGKFRIKLSRILYSNTYNPNDLGYLKVNNIISNRIDIAYNFLTPTPYFLKMKNSISIKNEYLYDTKKLIGNKIYINSNIKLKNNTTIGLNISLSPDITYDYFEPRVEDKFYIREPNKKLRTYLSTNYANPIAYDLSLSLNLSKFYKQAEKGFEILYGQRIQISKNAFFSFTHNLKFAYNNYGFIKTTPDKDSVFFGKRNIKYSTININFFYNFSPQLSTKINIRHYWSIVDYIDYYTLAANGHLYPLKYAYIYFDNQDINSNTFSFDFFFKWIFRPGSEFSIYLTKTIQNSTDKIIFDFYDNFENMYWSAPHNFSLSFRLLLYIGNE